MAREKLYKNLKIEERMARYLITLGCVEIPSKNKYRMFHIVKFSNKQNKNVDMYYFVGKSGAVRYSVDHKNAARTFSVTDRYRVLLENYEKDNNLI